MLTAFCGRELAALAHQHCQEKTGARLWEDSMKRTVGHVPPAVPLE
jgi:hypothetical protein